MTWILPAAIVLFLLAVRYSLERTYTKWSRRMEELEQRNAEMIEGLRKSRERTTSR